MTFLLLSIIASTITVSFFKLFEKAGVNTFQAIIFNYLTCAVVGNILAGKDAVILQPFWEFPWFYYTIIIGLFFISIFFAIGETAQKLGVSVSMVSAKLSVVIPVLVTVLFFSEVLSWMQVSGILISLVSVYLISRKEGHREAHGNLIWLLPLIVFIGSGVIDTTFNLITKRFNAQNTDPFFGSYTVTTAFTVAFFTGMVLMLYQLLRGKIQIQVKNIYWGVALGIPNYFSMYFLIKTLSAFSAHSAVILPVNNIGIVAASTLVSVVFFSEKLNRLNIVGLILSAAAILLLAANKL
jgi:drug/metabolite transporter (DMT)-like permease